MSSGDLSGSEDTKPERGKPQSDDEKPEPVDSAVVIEFLGVAKRRAGVGQIEVQASSVGDALLVLAQKLPAFASSSIDDGRLNRSFILSINGRVFTDNNSLRLEPGDRLVILSADAGG